MLPCANTEAMNLHLAEISRCVMPGAHTMVTLDGAGWPRQSRYLEVPNNISLLPLPPYTRAEPAGKQLAVSSSEPARQSDLPVRRRHRRRLLSRLEQPHRTAGTHHIHRNQRLGTSRQVLMPLVLYQPWMRLTLEEDFHLA